MSAAVPLALRLLVMAAVKMYSMLESKDQMKVFAGGDAKPATAAKSIKSKIFLLFQKNKGIIKTFV